jgi:hypothetical protein
MSGTFRFLRVACVMLTMPALCACFSPSMLPGATACTGLAAARPAPSSLRRRRQAVVLRAGLGDGDGATEDAKEAALRRLAGADAPKSAPKKVAQKEAPLPEWAFFVLPIFGAACAFAFQVSVCDVASLQSLAIPTCVRERADTFGGASRRYSLCTRAHAVFHQGTAAGGLRLQACGNTPVKPRGDCGGSDEVDKRS